MTGPVRTVLLGLAALLLLESPAGAVFSGEMSPRPRSGDADYADGVEAYDRKDWPAAIRSLRAVVGRRPHHDNAWTRLGYAYRKIGALEDSLNAYGRALSINPHNRAAIEYLGEAYLQLDRVRDAELLVDRLGEECKRVALTFSDGAFTDGCLEQRSLRKAIDAHKAGARDQWQ